MKAIILSGSLQIPVIVIFNSTLSAEPVKLNVFHVRLMNSEQMVKLLLE